MRDLGDRLQGGRGHARIVEELAAQRDGPRLVALARERPGQANRHLVTVTTPKRGSRANDRGEDLALLDLRARSDDRLDRLAVRGVHGQDALPGVDGAGEVLGRVAPEAGDRAHQRDLPFRRRGLPEAGFVASEPVGCVFALPEPLVETGEPLRGGRVGLEHAPAKLDGAPRIALAQRRKPGARLATIAREGAERDDQALVVLRRAGVQRENAPRGRLAERRLRIGPRDERKRGSDHVGVAGIDLEIQHAAGRGQSRGAAHSREDGLHERAASARELGLLHVEGGRIEPDALAHGGLVRPRGTGERVGGSELLALGVGELQVVCTQDVVVGILQDEGLDALERALDALGLGRPGSQLEGLGFVFAWGEVRRLGHVEDPPFPVSGSAAGSTSTRTAARVPGGGASPSRKGLARRRLASRTDSLTDTRRRVS